VTHCDDDGWRWRSWLLVEGIGGRERGTARRPDVIERGQDLEGFCVFSFSYDGEMLTGSCVVFWGCSEDCCPTCKRIQAVNAVLSNNLTPYLSLGILNSEKVEILQIARVERVKFGRGHPSRILHPPKSGSLKSARLA
jgi:hypothetical protein